ncbi:dynamin [Nostoc carneum NIES-2107]|nr:dynamin [Nostoc carneum NIES-2107]
MEVVVNQNNQAPETFTDYRKVLLTLTSDLKRLREFSKKLNLEKSIFLIDDVLDRVQTNSFAVAVVGEFKRGKSTFINALLGQEILPADVLPCSATLNRVTYGVQPLVKIVFRNGREEDVAIDKLADYVTKLTPESEETAANVKEAVVYYPVHYCQNNVDIIDTPGLNDEANMTEVTLSVLPQVDAAIMVVMAQSPLSEYEREFLETKLLTNDLGRIIFVVTGIDRYNNPGEAEKGIKYIQDRIQKFILDRAKEKYGEDSPEFEVYKKKIGKPKVFGLSAYQALQARRTDDNALLTQSRFREFEEALEKFLTQERGATFLQVPVNRAIASSSEILATLKLQENALAMKKEEFQAAYEKSDADIKGLRDRSAEEMKRIDEASENVKRHVQPLIEQLEDELKQAAEQEIESIDIKPSELRNKKALTDRLGRLISNAVEKAAQKQSEKIQSEIEQGLLQEVQRLEDFANSVDLVLQRIEMHFLSVNAADTATTNETGESIVAAIAVATGMGGVWAGFREAGVKGAAVGAAGSIGTAFTAYTVAIMLGLPLAFPVFVAVTVLSMLTSRELVKIVFGDDRVEIFKENYQKAVLQEIGKQLKENRIESKVNEQISEIFFALKQKVRQEVDSLLDNTQNQLFELRDKRARDEAINDNERQELHKISAETQRIQNNAQRLSQQLIQQVNIS